MILISAILMASGFSKRMGENKLLMRFKEKTILEAILSVIKNYKFKEKILVYREKEVFTLGKKYNFKCVENKTAHKGQSESIRLGLENARDCLGYMFFTGDQPFIDKYNLDKLVKEFQENKSFIIVPINNEKKGSPVIFPKNFKEELMNIKGDTGGREIIKEYPDKIKYVKVTKKFLLDIDNKEEYKSLLERGEI